MVEKALRSVKVGKTQGPSGATRDLIKVAGVTEVKWLFQVCESIKHEGQVPEQRAKGYTIPVYKGKGDVLKVDIHRGVRLLELETMKSMCIRKP